MTLTGASRSTGRQTCGSATVSIINLTWTYLASNTDLQGDRLATNSLSHGTACCIVTTGCLCPAPYRLQQGAPKVVRKFSEAL
jgi:hypothetical protein